MIQNLVSNQFLVQGGTEIEITLRPSTIAQMNWSTVIEKRVFSETQRIYLCIGKNSLFAGVLIQKSVDFIDVEAIA